MVECALDKREVVVRFYLSLEITTLMSLSLFSTEVLSTWLISLDSNLQKESSLSQLEYVSVSIDDNIRIKPQKVRKRKKINKITRIPEIYRKPF